MEMEGLVVDYNGNTNIVMYRGIKEYPIGELAAEYARLRPTELKEVILSFSDLDKEPIEEFLAPFFPWFADELEKKFGTVAAVMITIEFLDLVADVMKMTEKQRENTFKEDEGVGEKIKEFIFKDTHYSDKGMDTIEQLLLSCYLWYANSFVAFKHTFNILAAEEEYDEEQIMFFLSMFTDNMKFQHIDFKIACYDGEFHSLYTIKSSMSLILFEASHCIEKKVQFIKCANCGQYFVPENRSDTLYCNYLSPQKPNKTCREIGAQVAWSNKIKNDVLTKEYRKVYMKYKMITIRHPEDRESKKKFEILKEEMNIWRKNLRTGKATTEKFLEWLKNF